MKVNKKIFICALLLLIMLCVISTASATEPLNADLTSTDTGVFIDENINEELSISEVDEELSAEGDTITVASDGTGDYTTISAAVGSATGGETIFIKNGEYTETSKIDIGAKKLTFNGESQGGVIIKSGNNDLFYTTTSGYSSIVINNLVFKDISMTGAKTPVFIGGDGNLTITNCIFDNCSSRYGALRIYTTGSVLVDNCQFLATKSATGSYSSAIDFGGIGTANYTIKNSVIDSSSISSSNTASYIFGAIYSEKNAGTVILDNVTISNCNLTSSSGLIAAKGNMEIRKSKIINNYVYRDLAIAGLIFVNGGKTVTIENSMIKDNSNPNNILSANSASAAFDLHYNNIQNNSYGNSFANPDYQIYTLDANYWGSNSLPEGITASTWIVEENGVLKLNTGEELDVIIPGLNDGGEPVITDAIYVATDGNDENDGSIDSPVFNITKAIELAKAGSGNIIIKEGIYSQNGITIDDSIAIIGEGNVVLDGTGLQKASVFTVSTKDVTIKNIKFINLNARNGGALSIQGSSQSNLLDINVVVENCSFDNVTATRGGAIYAYYTKGKLVITNCNFTNMEITWGAVCAYQSAYDGGLDIEISKSIFANNTANNAGALYLQASYLTLTDSEIYNNTAAQSPGAIYLTNVTAVIDNCKIYDNSALKDASAIAVYAGKISSNPTVLKPSELTITNCIIEGNTATQEGAAAIYLENSKMNISYSSIVNTLNIHNTVTANYDNDKPEAVIANNNWWGVDDPRATVQGENITFDNWVIMNLEANVSDVLVGDTVKLTVDFNHVNTTSGEMEELTGGAIPKTFTVTFASDSGSIEPSSVDVTKGTSKSVTYTVADVDAVISAQTGEYIKTISFKKGVEPYYGIIYVSKDGDDNNNGSELYPVASIGKAIELALVSGGSGQVIINEGTYTGVDYHIYGNLSISGIGNVILDAESQGRLFYMAYGDNVDRIEIANLTIVNVKHNYGAAVYSMAKELILENLTISSAPETGSLISNTGKMTIKDCEIANHNGGNVITTSGNYDLIINNTVFNNNTVIASTSDYGIIYVSSGRGNLYIENSKFYNSTTRQGVIVSANSDKNIYVTSSEFINNHMQDTSASGGAISVNNKLEVSDSIFINNTACGDGGAINIGRWGDATITKSVFINNAAGNGKRGDAIYNNKKLKINYCVLISDGANKVIYHNGEDNDVDAQYNWWGTNDDPKNLVGAGTYEDDWGDDVDCVIDTSNWVIMTVSNNMTGELNIGDKVEFTVDFIHYMDSTGTPQALPDSIPEVDVSAGALYGELDSQQATTENNVASFVYTAVEGGEDSVTIASSDAVNVTPISVKVPVVLEVIYVSMSGDDNNDGARETPVATLKHAIEIAERGKIVILNGDYTITETLIVDKDLDITGMGTVTINGNQLGILENSANLNLTNIVFTNAKLGTGSVIKDNGNTTINGCTFFSCVTTGGSSAGPINNLKGTMIINNSKFYQNKGSRGVVASQQGTRLIINNSEFYDNDCTSITNCYGIVYSTSADTIVENTIFRNNKDKQGAGIWASRSTSATTGSLEVINCTFENNVANVGTGGAVFASGEVSVNIKDSRFINNTAVKSASGVGGNGGAIYSTGNSKFTVTDCLFIDNAGDADAGIYADGSTFAISNSVILAKDGDTNFALNKIGSTVTANDNFWGDNAKANTNANVARWIILNASYVKDDEGILTITATFDKTNSTSGEITDYTQTLPAGFDVTFTSSSGNLNEAVPVTDGQASVQYTLDKTDSEITVKVANAEVIFPFAVAPSVIYVSPSGDDNNDGNRETPVATLQHAVEIAENGQIVLLEGTYKTGYLGIISNDLNITGEGKVVIDAENNNRILYVGEDAKVVLKNLIMVNGYGIDGSGALLGNSNYLTIINCTLANSSAGESNGGAIYNVGYLTIIDSTIANNTAREGGAIFANDAMAKGVSISIKNSLIENNTATGNDNLGGGAIFTQQIAGLTINNSTFRNNKAEGTSSGGAIFISHSTASLTITDSEFIENHANGQEGTGGGAIYMVGTSNYERKGTLTISNTLFEDNTADANGGAVYARATTINIKNSVLLNNEDKNGLAVYGYKTEQVSPAITLNDNWWGSNEDPSDLVGGNSNYKPTITRWAILTITNDTPIVEGNTVKLTASINSYTNGVENGTLTNPINVKRPVSIRTSSGIIEGVLENGEFSCDYLVPANLKIISATVDDQTETLLVITSETVVTVENITGCQGETVNVHIIVKTTDGADVTAGEVDLYFGDEYIDTIPVDNGVASQDIVIGKGIGTYTITALFSDETEEFGYSEGTATLNVTGVNNIVTPETFSMFFDEDGNLKTDIPFDELFFEGTFENMGVITIGKPIKLTGRNAQFKDTAFKLDADNVVLNGVSIELTKNFDKTDGSAIYIGGDNVTVSNNNITYIAPDNVQSYAILVDIAVDAKIINNNIKYTAKSEGDVETMAIKAMESDNLVIEGNAIEANIPSVPVGYSHWPSVDYYSQAIHIENSDKVSVKNNDIDVKCSNVVGSFDSIYALYITSSDDANVEGNDIKLDSNSYGYGLVIDGQNLNILNNNIDVVSQDNYACGLNINSNSTALVDGNNISATSKQVSYPVYMDDWGVDASDITVSNNNIKGDSNCVYGIYTEGNKTNVLDNVIELTGNYTIGITSYQTDLVVKGNKIVSNGSNVGDALSPQGSVPVETTGICAAEGSVDIQNNDIFSSGDSTIDAINTTGTIKDNKLLTASGKRGDETIKANCSTLVIDNNKSSEPPAPVIKLTGKNVKIYYSYSGKYQVLVTIDGKAASGVSVKFTINGKTKTVKTNAKGYAILKIKDKKLKPKKYKLTASYGGKVIKNTLVVKQILKSSNKKVKKSAKKLVLKATLKKGKKAIRGKKITFKFKGKKYKAKTNKKGVAKVTIKKNVIKRLKAGKKYPVKITYLKDTIKKTVKVRR